MPIAHLIHHVHTFFNKTHHRNHNESSPQIDENATLATFYGENIPEISTASNDSFSLTTTFYESNENSSLELFFSKNNSSYQTYNTSGIVSEAQSLLMQSDFSNLPVISLLALVSIPSIILGYLFLKKIKSDQKSVQNDSIPLIEQSKLDEEEEMYSSNKAFSMH